MSRITTKRMIKECVTKKLVGRDGKIKLLHFLKRQGSYQRELGLYQKVSRAKLKTLHWPKVEQFKFQ